MKHYSFQDQKNSGKKNGHQSLARSLVSRAASWPVLVQTLHCTAEQGVSAA